MRAIIKLIIPLRKTNGEIIPNAYLLIEADKHGQTTITASEQPVHIDTSDLREAATTLWLFLKK